MKKILVLCAGMALVASTAFAVGIDLTAGACGNLAGSSNEAGAIDCANGGSVTLLAVFQPAEAYNDVANGYVLTGIDGLLDMQVNGVLASGGTAAFWDWDQTNGCNPAAFSANRKAPTTAVCAGYTNTFNVANSGEGAAAGRRSTSTQRIAFGCFRPAGTPLSTTADQKLFAAQFLIDGSTSLEAAGGPCGGCPLSAGIVWNAATPGVLNGASVTVLTGPSLAGNCVGVNTGASLCAAVPTKKHTWGQLKSLYR